MERCHWPVTEREAAGQPVLSGRKSKNVLAPVGSPCILIYCIPLLRISMGACLPETQCKISKSFYPKPATLVAFPFPSQKGGVVIQKLACQMTVELRHPVIWESLPRSVPPRGSLRSQHASISPPAPHASSSHAWGHQRRSLTPTCRGGLLGSHQRSIL